MQTTLLGIAITIILALVAALVGPLFVDWDRYRPQFEAEASRLTGLPVRVNGSVDLRLLPSPSLILSGIEIGNPESLGGVKARALGVEFALGPLLRGRLRAAQTRIIGPEVTLGLDKDGRAVFPKVSNGLPLDTIAIDRLNVDEAKVTLVDAFNATRVTLDRFWFHGEVRSLAGAFKGEGAFILNGGLYGYRIATSRPDDGATRIKLGIDPSDRPVSAEVEGNLTIENGEPRFEGSLNFSRSSGVVLVGGQTVTNEAIRLSSKVRANPKSASLEQIESQYGPDERAVKLTGNADITFGRNPRLDGNLSGRQLDLDKLATPGELPRKLPIPALKALKESFGPGFQSTIPARVNVAIDSVTLGGAMLQSVRGDLVAGPGGWSLEHVEFRAPGITQVQLDGKIEGGAGATFNGPIDVTTSDPRALLSWLDGRSDLPIAAIKPVRVRGDVTLGADTVGISNLRAEIDRKTFEGKALYRFADKGLKARLDAELRAPDVDVDALIDFGKTMLDDRTLERPGDVALAFDLGRVRLAGFEAKDAKARLRFGPNGLQVEQLAIADFGGIGLSGRGQIDTAPSAPRGNLTFDFDAHDWAGANALAAKFIPQSADDIRRLTSRIGAAKLHATLDVGNETVPNVPTLARLNVDGSAGPLKVSLRAEGQGDSRAPGSARVRIDATMGSDDGSALLRTLALDGLVPQQSGAGELKLQVIGPADGDLNVGARLSYGALNAESHGTARVKLDQVTASLGLMVTKSDGNTLPMPFTFQSRVALNGWTANVTDIAASVSKNRIRGALQVNLARPLAISGKIEADSLDASALAAAAIGMPAQRSDGAWSTEPFVKTGLPDISGRVEFKSALATLSPSFTIRTVTGSMRLSANEFAFEDVSGQMAAGQISGMASFRRSGELVNMQSRLTLKGADANSILSSGEGGPVSGKLGAQIEVEGYGVTPRALVGSLNGTGTVTLEKAEIAKLDPRVFLAEMRAADQGMPLDAAKIRDVAGPALDGGRLVVKEAEGAIGIVNGQARLGTVIAHADGADLVVSGSLDLVTQMLDGRLVLTATQVATLAVRPELTIGLKGPLAAPRRSLDVSALAGWLALRAVDQQSKKLEAIEAERASRAAAPLVVPSVTAAPPAPKAVAPLPPPLEIKPVPKPAAPRAASPTTERDRFFNQYGSQR